MAGVPIYAERGPGGGFELVDGYQTTLTGLTAPEACALLLAGAPRQVADQGLENALATALLKVSAALPESLRRDAEKLRERIRMDGVDAMEKVPALVIGHAYSKKLISPL